MQAPLKWQSMERRAGTPSNLGVLLVDRLGDLVLEFLAGFAKLTHAAAEAASEFRELLGAEEQQHGEENQKDLLRAKAEGDECGKRVHLIGSLGRGLGVVKGKFRRVRQGNGGGF